MKIEEKEVIQIAWEVALWSRDAYDLERLGQKGAFKPRFDKWIKGRIKMLKK
jgi:hypothetical protein